jgi:hypothetical protein
MNTYLAMIRGVIQLWSRDAWTGIGHTVMIPSVLCLIIYCHICIISWFTPYVDQISGGGGHQCGFLRNRSTTDQILCIRRLTN